MKDYINDKKYIIFLFGSIVGTSVFLLVPYLYVVFISFFERNENSFVGLKNYIEVFHNHAFITAMGNTFQFIVICVPLLLAISLLISLYIFENQRLGNLLKTGFLVPMAVPVSSMVLLWKCAFDDNGIINGLLESIGFQTVNWMNSNFAFLILVFSFIWRNLGYNIILWLAALSSINPDINEAAKLDGADFWQRVMHVILPSIKNGTFVIMVLAVINSFKVFREVYLVAGEYPDESIYMVQHIFNNWFRNLEMDKLAAGAVINSVILILLVLLLKITWERKGDE